MESDYITLNTGAHMPLLGLGTWNADPKTVGSAVEFALTEAGYRHIDCAFVYHNEVEVGQAFHKVFSANVARREDVFITSKLWSTAHRASAVLESCKQSLHDLQLEYLDLYLVHFPIAIKPGNGDEPLGEDGYVLTEKVSLQETWEAMEGLVKSGLVKNIGVSNYSATHILDLLTYAKVTPAVNQIELHPYLSQKDLVEFCKHLGISVTAYSPLGSYGSSVAEKKPLLLNDPVVQTIAKKHDKAATQVLLRWGIQRGTVVIPKSTTPDHIRANSQIFDFSLAAEDMLALGALNRGLRFVNPTDWWKMPFF